MNKITCTDRCLNKFNYQLLLWYMYVNTIQNAHFIREYKAHPNNWIKVHLTFGNIQYNRAIQFSICAKIMDGVILLHVC